MPDFTVGLYLPQDLAPERTIAIAQTAEQAGLDSVWLPDHLHQFPDKERGRLEAWTTLSAVARETTAIRLGVGVCNVQLRNEQLLAKMAFTLDQMSGGRLTLALGTGGNGREIRAYGFPELTGPQSREKLRSVVRALSAANSEEHDPLRCNPGPVQLPFPIIIAADHRETMRIVAREADWWYANLAAPERFGELNTRMTQACESEGREPGSLQRNAHVLAILGETQVEATAAAELYASRPRARLFERPHIVGDAQRVRLTLEQYQREGAQRACVYVLNMNERDGARAETLVGILGEAAGGTTF